LDFYLADQDQTVFCVDSISDKDPSFVWDTRTHEATSKLQACIGECLMRTTHVGAMMRRIQAIFPETLKNLDGYSSAHMRYELEARWMKLQTPATVHQLLFTTCRRA
jgi:hypothetical protein